jgi:hypothetical protein
MHLAPKRHRTQPSLHDSHSITTSLNRRKFIPTKTNANMTLPSNHRSWAELKSRHSQDYAKPNVSGRFPPHQETAPKQRSFLPLASQRYPTVCGEIEQWAQIRTLEFLCNPHSDHTPDSSTPTTELWTGHQNQSRGIQQPAAADAKTRSGTGAPPRDLHSSNRLTGSLAHAATKRKGEAR